MKKLTGICILITGCRRSRLCSGYTPRWCDLFQPTLPYCGGKKASQRNVNRKTAHLQRLACVSITGSMHSTPTAALEVILMLPPLVFIMRERQGGRLTD
jgi:hypothetical protein